jgi:predicted AAA+ superfamily ATPase
MEYGHSEKTYSQETANTIDAEVRRIITEAHTRAVKLLKDNRSILDNMARVLVEKETIYTEEVALLMKGEDYKSVVAQMEGKEEEHNANPFAYATTPSEEHLVKDEKEESKPVESVQTEAVEEPKQEPDTKDENNE